MSAGNFATLLSTEALPEFSDLIRKQFEMVNETVRPTAAQLYQYDDLTSYNSRTKRYDEVDIETYAELMEEGANAAKSRAGVGYNKTMEEKRVAKEIDITWKMRRYGKEYAVKNKLVSLVNFVQQRMELDLSHRLTFASATSYVDLDGSTVDTTTGDGLALAFSAHTLAHSTTTYRNRISGDPVFSQGSLELAESLFVSDILSNFGERRVFVATHIVTSDDPTTCRAVRQVLESTADIDAAHEGVLNYYKGKYQHLKLPYLATDALGARDATKKRYWFLIAVGQWQAYLGMFERPNMKTPAAGNNGEDVHNDNWTYGTRGSYGITTVSGRGLVASLPTS